MRQCQPAQIVMAQQHGRLGRQAMVVAFAPRFGDDMRPHVYARIVTGLQIIDERDTPPQRPAAEIQEPVPWLQPCVTKETELECTLFVP